MTAKRFNRVGGYVYDGEHCISHFEDVTHRDDIVTLLNELADENEQLKSFIKELTSNDGKIWLMNGYVYKTDKILKGDVE